MVFELPRQIRWNSYFEVPICTSQFPPHKAGNCSRKYYVVVAIENGTTYCFTITLLQLKPPKCSKSPPFSNITKFHPACPLLQSTWPRILGSGRTRSVRPAKIPKIWTGDFCWMESAQRLSCSRSDVTVVTRPLTLKTRPWAKMAAISVRFSVLQRGIKNRGFHKIKKSFRINNYKSMKNFFSEKKI